MRPGGRTMPRSVLEGSSRWNMNRAHEAVGMRGASQTKLYNIRLMSNINDLSNKVLGNPLLPEFIPPGRPTGERIAVEYLLEQSDKGDLLGSQQHCELGNILPDLLDEVQEDEFLDVTVSDAADILTRTPPEAPQYAAELDISPPHSPPFLHSDLSNTSSYTSPEERSSDVRSVSESPDSPARSVHSEDNSSSGPSTSSQESRSDVRGFPGWEVVDKLAGYLVNLNRTITALSASETDEIVRLYSSLHTME
ncbi:unnamed protein product [Pleuronectes platessa]|uniref:Uncharacterized protein n=1 Tax=Pleuronectes platessa TaxID=8262 RepID=A0A9N7UME2_PLEPL|nr:unnamed protein product [Pleuronectes platessa]